MKMQFIMLPLIPLFLPDVLTSEDGSNCEVVKEKGNGTYTEVTWCDHGCCHDDDQRETCCNATSASKITNGMVYGFVITGSLVVLIFGVYVRLKMTANTVKPPGTTAAPAVSEVEAHPEASSSPQEEPPPPYWMCVSDNPPPPFPHALTSSEDHVPTPRHRPEQNSTRAEEDDEALSSTTRASSQNGYGQSGRSPTHARSISLTDLSKGVILQPSAFREILWSSTSSSSGAAELCPESGPLAELCRTSLQEEGTVVVFLPGQLSSHVCQSLLQSSETDDPRYVVYNTRANIDGSADFNRSSARAGCSNPSYVSTEEPETETASSTTVQSRRAASGGVLSSESLQSEILKTIHSGTIVYFEKRGGSMN